jgi:Kelch motif
VAKNKFYVISGGDVSCSDVGGATATTAVDVYDPVTNSFSSGPSVNIGRDEYPLAARVGNYVFLVGGTAPCGATVRSTERLNLSTGKWTVLPSTSDLPPALDGAEHCGAAIGNKIYYFQAAGIGVFDSTTRTWSVLPPDPLLSPSSFCRATRVGDEAVITGPGDGSADAFSQRILVFDSVTDTITQLSSTTVPLAEHTSGFLRGQVVVAGGDFSGETSVQGINVPLNTVTTFDPLPALSDDAVGDVIGDTYYILGGNNGVTNTPPVLIGTPIS